MNILLLSRTYKKGAVFLCQTDSCKFDTRNRLIKKRSVLWVDLQSLPYKSHGVDFKRGSVQQRIACVSVVSIQQRKKINCPGFYTTNLPTKFCLICFFNN